MSSSQNIPLQPAPLPAKTRLLNAALHIVRQKGYAATTVDDICREAGVTKGSFFHHFKSKDDLALAAIEYWEQMTGALFAQAPYHQAADPVDRLLGYIDFRAQILGGDLADYTCLLGTLVQETYDTHPHLRSACLRALSSHIDTLTRDAVEARERYTPDAPWTPESLGTFIQAVLQGSFIFAKAHHGAEVAHGSIDHLRRYIEFLFRRNFVSGTQQVASTETRTDRPASRRSKRNA
jgi:TetR/AcrR family transcriptional repressor of nem operon